MAIVRSRNVWVTSDTHLGHENMIKWDTGRPEFETVEDMNDLILENWNSVVNKGDIVYHLGDVTMMQQDYFRKFWPKFKGKKRLIVGNHDDINFLARGGFFSKVMFWRKFSEFGLILSHVPLHDSSIYNFKAGKKMKNIHGHVHHRSLADTENYKNVCVEKTNYTPVNIEDLRIIT